MRNAHFRTWIMVSKLKNVKNQTQTLNDLEYGEKQLKTKKKYTLKLDHVEKIEKREKREMHTAYLEYGKKNKKWGK